MTTERLAGGAPLGAEPRVTQQVVHTIRPQLGWIGTAIIAMLVLQLCTMLLVALRIGTPASGDLDVRKQRLAGREEAVERLLGHVEVDPDGTLNVESWIEEYQTLRDTKVLLRDAAAWKAQIDRLEESKKELDEAFRDKITTLENEKADLKADLEGRIAELEGELSSLKEPEAAEDDKPEDETAQDDATNFWTATNITMIVIASLIILSAAAVIFRMMLIRRRRIP